MTVSAESERGDSAGSPGDPGDPGDPGGRDQLGTAGSATGADGTSPVQKGDGAAVDDVLAGLSEPGVRDAVARLSDAEGRSPQDAVPVYDDVHRRLGAVLAGDGAPPAPGGPPRP